jgi:hypothetical protein
MRPGCGLCEEMAADLSDLHVPFDLVDVEQDTALESAYGEIIPVLFDGEREVTRAPHTRDSLKMELQRAGVL